MVKNVLIYPENKDILTSKSETIDIFKEDIEELAQNLKDTLHNSKSGVGISAVQIGVLKRMCVIHYNGKDIVMINPEIIRAKGEIDSKEGCLSVPDKYGIFKRFQKVWCSYIDEFGNPKEISDGGFVSRVIQHELDHMDGWCPVFDLAKDGE